MDKQNDTPARKVDVERGRHAVRELLEALGYDSSAPRFQDTPDRVIQSFVELTQARPFTVSRFPNTSSYQEPMLLKNIAFVSVCEHHLLPFRGVAHVGYVPEEEIVGLSTIPYIVEKFAHNLHLQEPLTDEIADFMFKNVSAKGVAVAIEADHMCMQVRGARSSDTKTITHAFRGELQGDQGFRNWFYKNTNIED